MKIFISWSGERSRVVASALHDWIPNVLQAAEPWMSASDIDKGARWHVQLAQQLAESQAGIICVTADNVNAPWLLFEAGCLAKAFPDELVCPYLFDVGPENIAGPLAQFQAARAAEKDTLRLLNSLNSAVQPRPLAKQRLITVFRRWWPDLSEELKKVPSIPAAKKEEPARSDREILTELVGLVRGLARANEPALLSERDQYRGPGGP